MREDTNTRAKGKWPGILMELGVSSDIINGKHQACPLCSAGKDRFRFTDKDGRGWFVCNVCGTVDGLGFLMKFHGWSFKEAADKVDAIVPNVKVVIKSQRSDSSKRAANDRLWKSAKPVHPRDPVGRYLIRRIGITSFPSALRTAMDVRFDEGHSFPCMLAMLTAPDGKPAILHRTYLTMDGDKAPVDRPKKLMSGTVPDGSAVRLSEHNGTLGLAEGIESALSVTKMFGFPCWASIGTALMEKWKPPEGVTKVTIYCDADENFSGQASAYALAHRIYDRVNVDVRFPPEVGIDWNDILNGR